MLKRLFKLSKALSIIYATCLSSALHADTLMGIIGGEEHPISPYGPPIAFFVSPSGTLTPLSPLPSSGTINSVAINSAGTGIIGGQEYSNPTIGSGPAIAYLVSPSGSLSSLGPLPSSGTIDRVAINSSGAGIIGGVNNSNSHAIAYLVSPSGSLTSLNAGLPSDGLINVVAINNAGMGIIGGQNSSNGAAIAYLVSPSGSLTSLNLGPPEDGFINSVAINNSGTGIIGGHNFTNNTVIAYLVSPNGALTSLSVPSDAFIDSAAINDAGTGIIGGISGVSAIAFLVSPSGALTSLGPLPDGLIDGGAVINSSGAGIIGGSTNGSPSAPLAYLVSPSGALTSLNAALPADGFINSVAINDAGAGIIGGENNAGTIGFAYLVSPNGALTPLDPPGPILSVAITSLLSHIPTSGLSGNVLALANYINQNASGLAFYFVPSELNGTLAKALSSATPTRNAFGVYQTDNVLFFLNDALSMHSRDARMAYIRNNTAPIALGDFKTDSLIAQNQEAVVTGHIVEREKPFEIWGTLLGALAHQRSEHQAPAFHPSTGAAIVAFDGRLGCDTRLGAGAAYAFSHIDESQEMGFANIHQENLFLYALWDNNYFYFDAAIWGGLFQTHNVRKVNMTGFSFRSKADINGWQLTPHLELGYDFRPGCFFTIEPFVMADWANNWQDDYKEHGDSPFNMGQNSHYSSFLRTMGGVRFYEAIDFCNWSLIFQEAAAYIYRRPFKVGRVQAFIIGSPGFFTVDTFTTAQNLGFAELQIFFVPKNPSYPYVTLDYQGEFGSQYQAQIVSLNVNWNF